MKDIDRQSMSDALITSEPIQGFCLPFTLELIEKLNELMNTGKIYRLGTRGSHLTLITAVCCKHLANQLGGETNAFTTEFSCAIEEMRATPGELDRLLNTAKEFCAIFMKK